MLTEEEKRKLEYIVTESPESSRVQRELEKLVEHILDDIMDKEGKAGEGSA